MDRDHARDYICSNFEESDRLALVLVNKRRGAATQRIATAERIASREVQTWLRHENEEGRRDIYLSMNALKPDAQSRTKDDIGEIRHIYLDFDKDGEGAAARMIESLELPPPTYMVETSPQKRHVIWRVEEFTKDEAESLQKNLARQWGADPAATDCSRVLRLPGFYNHKYDSWHWVRIEATNPGTYSLRDFPPFPKDRLLERLAKQERRPKVEGPLSQSEKDWAFAKRALARGDSEESVVRALAEFRRNDKPNPLYYAKHTVQKAALDLGKERGYIIVDGPER